MSEMGLHDPFGHLKHKLWSKEGPEIKLAIWLPPLKTKNRPDFFACRWHVTYRWKALDKVYNVFPNLISIKGLWTKLWAPKVAKVLTLGISRLPLGNLGTKCHLDASPVASHIIYYKGEGDGFPQVRVVVSLVNLSLPVACSSIKSAPTMH
jgi:hypothetical protein